ncbi:hypothetical protein, partial [Arthrobacter sp. 7Tela_A1]|uniref:hypothetical protein n=1 Tax=Arthrobacter sp. 7Tela_A1 TaxID=3093745 RepID=UPI003BB641E7
VWLRSGENSSSGDNPVTAPRSTFPQQTIQPKRSTPHALATLPQLRRGQKHPKNRVRLKSITAAGTDS